ncbi:hypothetical protein MJO29_010895 [Puccinia striiformis f. sp. tritici]|nr:hypothetical protein MJO29_010895 [Puccinia striiformis f. sp. tritici]
MSTEERTTDDVEPDDYQLVKALRSSIEIVCKSRVIVDRLPVFPDSHFCKNRYGAVSIFEFHPDRMGSSVGIPNKNSVKNAFIDGERKMKQGTCILRLDCSSPRRFLLVKADFE